MNGHEKRKLQKMGHIMKSTIELCNKFGSQKVTGKKIPNLHFTIGALGGIGAGLVIRGKYNKTYDAYLAAREQNEIQSLKNQADKEYSLSTGLLAVGGAVWIADILLAINQAIKNDKKNNNRQSLNWKLKPSFETLSSEPLIGISLVKTLH